MGRGRNRFLPRGRAGGQQTRKKVLSIPDRQGDASENHHEVPPHACHNGVISKSANECGEDVGRREPCALGVGPQLGAAPVDTAWRVLRTLETELPSEPAGPWEVGGQRECRVSWRSQQAPVMKHLSPRKRVIDG